MRLLLDTHVFLWAVSASPRLTPRARQAIESAEAVHVSAASIWEVAIKARLGKIEADVDELAAAIAASGFIELPVRAAHAAAVARLPPLHQDPFDRLLVAQAVTEPLRLLTADALLARYTELVIPA
jgi:PIN domain nuclease of toxin-antitoxin system